MAENLPLHHLHSNNNYAFWCLQIKYKLDPWSIVYILQQQHNALLIFPQMKNSKIHNTMFTHQGWNLELNFGEKIEKLGRLYL